MKKKQNKETEKKFQQLLAKFGIKKERKKSYLPVQPKIMNIKSCMSKEIKQLKKNNELINNFLTIKSWTK